MDTYVYVDGFNLYYGAVKRTPLKWLDIKALAQPLPNTLSHCRHRLTNMRRPFPAIVHSERTVQVNTNPTLHRSPGTP